MSIPDAHTHHRDSPAPSVYSLELSEIRSQTPPHRPFCVGLHPWWSSEVREEDWYKIIELSIHPFCVAIGESGLDRLRGAALPIQHKLWLRHWELAHKLNKPLVHHLVRSLPEFSYQVKHHPPQIPLMLHDWRGSEQDVLQLSKLSQKIYFSVGPHAFGRQEDVSMLKLIPAQRLLLESDERDFGALHEFSERLAKLRGLTLPQLSELLEKNMEIFRLPVT